MIEIKRQDTTLITLEDFPTGAILHRELGSEHYIKIAFTLPDVVYMKVGDYISLNVYGLFELTKPYIPKYDMETGGYKYDLQFDSYYRKWGNKIVKYIPTNTSPELSFKLTAPLATHMGVILSNLRALGYTYNGVDFDYSTLLPEGSDIDFSAAVLVIYDNIDILSAIGKIADAYKCEYWVDDNYIRFGKCQLPGTPVVFRFETDGNNHIGNVAEMASTESKQKYANRIYAFGSERNLPSYYRKELANPFEIDKEYMIYDKKVRFTCSKPVAFFSENFRLKVIGGRYDGKEYPFIVVKGTYELYGEEGTEYAVWYNPEFEIDLGYETSDDGFVSGLQVAFDISENEHIKYPRGQRVQNIANIETWNRDSFNCFSFSQLSLKSEAIQDNSTIKINSFTLGLQYVGYIKNSDGIEVSSKYLYRTNDGLSIKSINGGTLPASAVISNINLTYVSNIYLRPIAGQSDIALNGVVQKRLMLPTSISDKDKEDGVLLGNGYIQDVDASENEIVEGVFVDEKVYPRTQLVVDKISTYTDDSQEDDAGNTIITTFYRISPDWETFDYNDGYQLQDQETHIIFQSGKMTGMDFEVQYQDNTEGRYFEININSDYGRDLPDDVLHPQKGDKFILYGWDASKIGQTGLVESAELELYKSVCQELKKTKQDPNTYDCTMDSIQYREWMVDTGLIFYSLGTSVMLINYAFFENGSRLSRIIGYEIKLDIPYDNPKYIVGESAKYSRSQEMQKQIDSLTYNGQTYNGVGNGGGISFYLITTSDTTAESDTNVYSAARTKQGFLSRQNDDTAKGHITFEKEVSLKDGAKVSGDLHSDGFVSGMNGWSLDERGNMEVETIHARSALITDELRVNRQQGQEGDTIFADNDQIERVDVNVVDDTTYYTLTLKEKWEGYFTAQEYGNIIRGKINTLAAKDAGVSDYSSSEYDPYMGVDNGGNKYYESWMRVVATHNTNPALCAENQIRVVLYSDDYEDPVTGEIHHEVPAGKNFPPCDLMTIARWGCALEPSEPGISEGEHKSRERRQQLFYISVSDGRIAKLSGVNQPILRDSNYGTTLGTVPDFVKDWAINDRLIDGLDYLYAQGVIVGDFIKVDIQGRPLINYVDCGEWVNGSSIAEPSVGHGIYLCNEKNDESLQWETHDVWHNGHKWRCQAHQPVVSGNDITYYEPTWNSAYWTMIEGNDNYTIEFVSSRGYSFRRGFVQTEVTPHLFYGNTDITADIDAQYWTWTRCEEVNQDKENPYTPQDETWNAQHSGVKVIQLSNADMPSAWSSRNKTIFTCTVSIMDGKHQIIVQNQLIS